MPSLLSDIVVWGFEAGSMFYGYFAKHGRVPLSDANCFQAISCSTGHLLITALDARAAAYEKVEQLQPALRDAKRIIDLKPELAKVIFPDISARHE